MMQDSSYITSAYAVLPFCKGVSRLTFWMGYIDYDPHLAELVSEMRPIWVSARLANLLNVGPPDFALPFFSRLTHLRIIDPRWFAWSNFHLLFTLTHVYLSMPPVSSPVSSSNLKDWVTRAVNTILTKCPKLMVCVLNSKLPLDGINDFRVVFIIAPEDPTLDWRAFTGGGKDTFAYAEKEVQEQKRNQCFSPVRYVGPP